MREYRYFAADFETTVYDGQTETEVWAAAICELNTERTYITNSIDNFFDYIFSIKNNLIIYFHNLKFDGEFILAYLKKRMCEGIETDGDIIKFKQSYKLKNNEISYRISKLGAWYSIIIKHNKKIIEIRDSLKLLPFTLKKIGEDFKTKHQKLEIEYEGIRYAGGEITPEEKQYISNDVLVLKEALEIISKNGNLGITIGSECLKEYKRIIGSKTDYDFLFPNLYNIKFLNSTIGEFIRGAYRGGWCYLHKPGRHKNGSTYDVNSLYASMMHSESGNYYPVGKPITWLGNYIPQFEKSENIIYFMEVKTQFYLKAGKLPYIQIKGSPYFKGTEMLKNSDIKDNAGNILNFGDNRVTLFLSNVDYDIIKEHYHLIGFEIIKGCYFESEIGIFDEYIDKYKKIKEESEGAMRQIAKLFLTNLYGKFAASEESDFKMCEFDENGVLKYKVVEARDKIPGYIAIGAMITAYSRRFTIRAAQANYDKFVYADTDSIHILGQKPKQIDIHPTHFCCWKRESEWSEGVFIRPKTYLEVIEGVPDIKCAGMPEKCKKLFIKSCGYDIELPKLSQEEEEFIQHELSLDDFKIGLEVPGKLGPKRIKGGIILQRVPYKIKAG